MSWELDADAERGLAELSLGMSDHIAEQRVRLGLSARVIPLIIRVSASDPTWPSIGARRPRTPPLAVQCVPLDLGENQIHLDALTFPSSTSRQGSPSADEQ